MRIGVDARPLSYQLTGIGVYLRHLLDTLQKIDRSNYYYLLSNAPIEFNLNNEKWVKIGGSFKKKLVSTIWMQAWTPILAHSLNLNIFWGPRHNLPLLLPSKVKTVLTIHDIVHRLHPTTMAKRNFISERLFMRCSLIKADTIITDSRSTAKDIQQNYPINSKKIQTIHLGIPDLPSDIIIDTSTNPIINKNYFLFVGTLDPRKNFKRILKAFELLKPQQYDVHLALIGGQGWKNKTFWKSLKIHPLKEYIHYIGYVDRGELAEYYRNALCLLFPSLYEGFGFPILEAMACGTPVISSNISSMPEIAGDAAILVDPYNVVALAKAMHKVLTDGKLRKVLIKKGFGRVKNFSWEQCATDTLKVFSLLADRPSR
ncbi:MAG: glycosyltransferase family 4 protein [Deltaproteobacteria bacterium]|nr:glycosyltransferase family 4 protein [Deltaproteobacteria bacterium]